MRLTIRLYRQSCPTREKMFDLARRWELEIYEYDKITTSDGRLKWWDVTLQGPSENFEAFGLHERKRG